MPRFEIIPGISVRLSYDIWCHMVTSVLFKTFVRQFFQMILTLLFDNTKYYKPETMSRRKSIKLLSQLTFACSKSTTETLEKGVFTVSFEHISYVVLKLPFLTLNK